MDVVQVLQGDAASFAIGSQHLRDRGGRGGRGEAKYLLYCTRDPEERDATFEEGSDGDLIGGVEGDAV